MATKSKAYRAAAAKIAADTFYTPTDAVALAKETGSAKFDSTVEVALKLGVDPRKADQMVRGTVNLPHGTGKTVRVIVFATGPAAEAAIAAGADEVGGAELIEKLAREVQTPFTGSLDRRRRSFLKVAKNFSPDETIRRNLKHYDPDHKKIIIQDPFFFSRIKRQVDRWQLIIVVDQSGSMLDSVIHSAVTASIFWGIRAIKTHLVVFDTEIVDLTADCQDPVDTLMKVQLGGGTDIGKALRYAESLIENPRRTIILLITDFYEGGPINELFAVTKHICEGGSKLLGLAALDGTANPCYDQNTAQRMVNLGAEVGAMTPGELAAWVAEKVR